MLTRVLFDGIGFQDGMLGGGVNRYCRELIGRVATNPDMDVAVYGSLRNWPDGKKLKIRAIPDFRVRENHRFCSTAKSLNELIDKAAGPLLPWRERSPDIFHLPYYRMPARFGRVVVTLYDMLMEKFPELFNNPYCDSVRRQKRASIAAADHVICISESSRNDVVEFFGVPKQRISVTYLASSLLPPSGNQPQKDQSPSGEPFILYVGSRFPHKNLAGLFAAMGSWEHRQNVRLVCVGGGGEWSEAERKLLRDHNLENRIERRGHVPDAELVQLYRQAICAVCPSLYEGFGLPVLEAMECGGIVCASQTSSLPEVGGDVAIYFDPRDPASIAAALSRAVHLSPSQRGELVLRGRQRAGQFSWQAMADQTVAVYRSILAG